MKKDIILLIIFLIGTNSLATAQIKHNSKKHSNVIIEGDLDDSLITKYGIEKLSVLISEFPSNHLIAPVNEYQDTIFDIRKRFKFIIPTTRSTNYMTIDLYLKDSSPLWSSWDNIYIVDKDDRIKCKLSNKFYEFYGDGAEKLNCQSEIYKFRYQSVESELELLNSKRYDQFYKRQEIRLDSLLKLQIAVVKRYAPKLSKEMVNVLMANCYGLRYYMSLHVILVAASLGYSEQFKAYLNSSDYKNLNLRLNKKADAIALVTSPIYTDFLFEKINIDNLIKNGEVEKGKPVVSRIYNSIMSSYQGILREKLLATFVLNYKYTDTRIYWSEILKTVKTESYKNVLLAQMKLKDVGAPFFPFELQDKNGQTVTLSELKGKVAIMDFWYTGCENCILLNKGMAPVIEKYKDNRNVLFVSVSTDKSKKEWLNSLEGDLYSHPESLNLYTNGLGRNHPLIIHYNITGYPTLFVLKNGKMFAPTPDRPSLDKMGKPTNQGNTGLFIKVIEDALKTNI